MVIIYGGIQPDGLVLSIHTVTIDTSKRNRSTVLPGVTTLRPTFPPSPPPIRGTVPPISKWAPYDRYNPRQFYVTSRPSQGVSDIRDWAKRMFNFSVNEDPITSTTSKPISESTSKSSTMATGSSLSSLAPTIEINATGKPTSEKNVGQRTPSSLAPNYPSTSLLRKVNGIKSTSPTTTTPTATIEDYTHDHSTSKEISLEELLLSTLDKLASQYKNSSKV